MLTSNEPGRRVSQRDIARVARVSQSAVSLVLNGKATEHNIPASTQQRIRRAIDELHYVPDPAARSLRGGRNGIVGVHTYEPVFPVGPDDYFHEFLVGIEQQSAELGRDILLFASTQGPDGSRSIYGGAGNRLRLADGAVILGLARDDDELRRLSDERYPFVVIGRRDVAGAAFAYVAVDYASAVGAVVEALAAAGHHRVGYLRTDLDESPQRERRAAVRKRCRELSLGLTIVEPRTRSGTASALRRLRREGVTAVIAENVTIALAVAAVVAESEIVVPDQLSVVCLDLVPPVGPIAGWSHLDIHRRAIGARAVQLLADILDQAAPIDHREAASCTFVAPEATIRPPAER